MSEVDSNPTVRREAALLAGAICHACGHGRSSHADRSGLCGVEGCRCEGMPNAFTHEVYPDPLLGGMAGYQAACHTCPWRGRAGSSKPEAWDEALTHGHEMEFQTEAHESIGVYAARAVSERDSLREALRQIRTFTGEGPHIRMGEACGVDACIGCLIYAVADEALAKGEHPYAAGPQGGGDS